MGVQVPTEKVFGSLGYMHCLILPGAGSGIERSERRVIWSYDKHNRETETPEVVVREGMILSYCHLYVGKE